MGFRVDGVAAPVHVGSSEQLRFQIPVPAGKKLVGADTTILTFPLDAPLAAVPAGSLLGALAPLVAARVGGATHYVLVAELRPDRPAEVEVRVLLPRFA